MKNSAFFKKLTPEEITILKITREIGSTEDIISGVSQKLVYSLLKDKRNPVKKTEALMQKLVDIQTEARKQMEAAIKDAIYKYENA